MNPCPTRMQLEQLLAVQLRSPEAEAVEAHVEACASCQQQLEELTNAIDFQGCQRPDSPDPAEKSALKELRPARAGEHSGEDFLRQLAQELPAGTWAFQERGGDSAAGTPPSTNPSVAATLEPPVVAGYDILGKLGRGGMGVVYQARQRDAHRVVALKMILAGAQARPDEVARFRTEIEAVARLQHPHIIHIYEVGEQDGRPYFSMEFADGGSLAQQLVGVPLPCRRAAQLLEQLARAIQYAHERGVLHRDLNPTNVLLMADGTPKITDFGLAKIFIAGGATLTQSGVILGTPSYMPPEQAAGGSKEIGPAGDVYALGAILYEMLTGRPPFRAETPLETLRQVISEEPVPPSRLQPHLPRDLVTICLKCLRKEPLKRYASALALADDLQRFLADQPITARRTGMAERAWRWCRRKPIVATLTATVALLLVTLAVGSTLSALWLREQRNEATEKLWDSYLAQARVGRLSRQIGQRFQSLEALAKAVQIARARPMLDERFREMRREAVACLALTDLRVLSQRKVSKPWRSSVAFDATLKRAAWCDDQGDICLIQIDNEQEILHLPGPGLFPGQVFSQFSPDGRFLAAGYNFLSEHPPSHRCLVWEFLESGGVRRVPLTEKGRWLAFRPDSRGVAIGQADGSIGLYDFAADQEKHLCPGFGAEYLAFHPDGKLFACSRADHPAVVLVNAATGDKVGSLEHPAEIRQLAWSGDGRLLAAGCDVKDVYIWDMGARRLQAVLQGHQKEIEALTFHPGSGLLASASRDGTTRLWDPINGRHLVSAPGQCVHFSSDGRKLAFYHDAQLGIWEMADRHACTLLHDGRVGNRTTSMGTSRAECLAFHPSGRLLVSASLRGLRFWDVATAQEMAHLPIGRQETVLFHPDGTRLFAYGRAGLHCWPIRAIPGNAPEGLWIGPPEALDVPRNQMWFRSSCSRDGRVLAVSDYGNSQTLVLDIERPGHRVVLRDCPRILSLAVSPDGRWVAAGLAENTTGVKVWDATSGQVERAFSGKVDEKRAYVAFSPDSQWLVMGESTAFRFWKVGSWEPGPVLAREHTERWIGPLAFTLDNGSNHRMLALAHSLRHIQLVDPGTLRELATLSVADMQPIIWLCFSPDGTRLAALAEDHTIQLWDLCVIRRELADIDLDWDQPPYPPAEASREAIPLKVIVDLGELAKGAAKEKAR